MPRRFSVRPPHFLEVERRCAELVGECAAATAVAGSPESRSTFHATVYRVQVARRCVTLAGIPMYNSMRSRRNSRARTSIVPFIPLLLSLILPWILEVSAKQRARDLGIPFEGEPGVFNAITDVPGVAVGHVTLIEGEGALKVGEGPIRTGVTAILPSGKTWRPLFAAWHSFNGNGELTGTTWIEESGFLEEPILLTNTRSVGVVHDAVWSWRMARSYHDRESGFGWAALPVVGETWDGRLNDIQGNHVKKDHVFAALDGAVAGEVAEGNVGGGTGMVCHQFKGGIGTASRQVEGGYLLGVLVQANYGLRDTLTIAGVPVGKEIAELKPEIHSLGPAAEGNSILIVVATDAPLLPHQLKRLAKRATAGLARIGGMGGNSSGDLFLAFSTAATRPTDKASVRLAPMLDNGAMDPFFHATVQATEEAIINALIAAETMKGINGNKVYALPRDRLAEVMRKYGRLKK